MNMTLRMRDNLLDVAYTLAVYARHVFRYVVRPTEVGVRLLVIRDGEVLLVRHRSGRNPWGLPGGGVKPGETLEDAARREVLEESGCSVQVEHLHGVFHSSGRTLNVYTIVFVCLPLADVRPPVGDLEIADARFFSIVAMPADTEPGTRCRIAEYLGKQTGLTGRW